MDWSERIGRRIKLRDLHILLAVEQCGSMARAAEYLAISKPVISKAIGDLEHVLGVRVLERDRHGAELTTYGAALLKRGITVFDELRESVKDIEFLTNPTAGRVRIGCNPILATGFVSAVVDRLSDFGRASCLMWSRGPENYCWLSCASVELIYWSQGDWVRSLTLGWTLNFSLMTRMRLWPA